MTIFDIGWLISIILWTIFFVLMCISYKKHNQKSAMIFNLCQICMLIPIWGFLIIGR